MIFICVTLDLSSIKIWKKDAEYMSNQKQNHKYTNRLINEKSPYLLQHAYNPVAWYPWGSEAFEKAKSEDKPIFLSIGYSTCHWCHVMERESFEDEEVAEYLKEHYVSIKVDREERPDIDHIYMTVCQAMTGQGGWPLTILMTPDQKPFYAGTYFPKGSKYGRPGLMDLLTQINELWRNKRDKILETSEKVEQVIQPQAKETEKHELTAAVLEEAYTQHEGAFDPVYGGFGTEPKFPTPHHFLFLLREWKRTESPKALEMVTSSLEAMHQGGIYDHLGYGFARYSVDKKWLVPHFEKMLYDNALLASTYIEAYQATQNEKFARIAEEIFQYVEQRMTSPEGGFYSAEDADSEGEEGKFYVWNPLEIEEVLGQKAGELFCEVFDVTNEGNFEGKNILNLIHRNAGSLAKRKGLTEEELETTLAESRAKLLAYREKRVPPHKDDKILTSWNGLLIASLAKAGAALQSSTYLQRAKKAVEMIENYLVDDKGRLLARYRDGQADFLAYLDDYAFYIWGLHELYFASGEPTYLERAENLIDDVISLFWDDEHGGFYFYGKDGETLITRNKEIYDGAIPSGNSVMAFNLVRQHRLTGKEHYQEYLEKLIDTFSATITHYPMGHSFFLMALQMVMDSSVEIVISEGDNKEVYESMLQQAQQTYSPFSVLLAKSKKYLTEIDKLAPAHHDKQAKDGQSAFYLCQNFACQQPVVEVELVKELLRPTPD